MKRCDIVQGIISWNNRFPLDRWWRMKHKVAFLSQAHRESSFISQLIEFEEDKLFVQLTEQKEKIEYTPGTGDFLRTPQTLESFSEEAQREIDEMLKFEENGE